MKLNEMTVFMGLLCMKQDLVIFNTAAYYQEQLLVHSRCSVNLRPLNKEDICGTVILPVSPGLVCPFPLPQAQQRMCVHPPLAQTPLIQLKGPSWRERW